MTSDKQSKEAQCVERDKHTTDMRAEMDALEISSNVLFVFEVRRIYREHPAWVGYPEWADFVERELALRRLLSAGNPNG